MAVVKNDAGFRGRQWESDVTGQQYATKRDGLEAERRVEAGAEALRVAFPDLFSDYIPATGDSDPCGGLFADCGHASHDGAVG